MKLIKTISLTLGMLAVTTAVNAQQTTTQKTETVTPASGTVGTPVEKKSTGKHVSSKKAPDRNNKGKGVDPSLSNSTNGRTTSTDNKQKVTRADSPARNRTSAPRRSSGMRDNNATKQGSSTTPRQTSPELIKQ